MAIKGERIKNYDGAVQMYKNGFSIGEVADYYGITRQAMWMILKRRDVKFRSNLKYGDENHFYRGKAEKLSVRKRAMHIVEKALKRGKIKKESCCVCGSEDNLEGHHDDYNMPLNVKWMCHKHHHEWHKTNAAIPRREVLSEEANAETIIDLLSGGPP